MGSQQGFNCACEMEVLTFNQTASEHSVLFLA